MSPAIKRKIQQVFPFGVICGFFGILWSIIVRGILGDAEYYPATGFPYDFQSDLITNSVGSLLFGWGFGIVEVFHINKFYRRKSFGSKILGKFLLYFTILCLFLITLSITIISFNQFNSGYEISILDSLLNFITTLTFWSVIAYMGSVLLVMLFYSTVREHMGHDVLNNFMSGKYHGSIEEERVFMFLDMKSSTTIAENLGHSKYYELLNDFFEDLSTPIVNSRGEVYEYVGDEVVVSWKLENALLNNNCLKCFFMAKEVVEERSQVYLMRYGIVPKFKAGIHCGRVTVGEIGVLKKQIVFTGDTLNTTARIQSLCNHYHSELLLSERLIRLLDLSNTYVPEEIGICELRGRNQKIKLFSVKKKELQ